MMCVLLFVWDVSILRECECDGNAGVGDGGDVISVSKGCECIGGTCGSDDVARQ